MCQKKNIMTTDAGRPVRDNQKSLAVGPRGPIIFEDFLRFEYVCRFTLAIIHANRRGNSMCSQFSTLKSGSKAGRPSPAGERD